jgi:hypothetical protein
MPTTHDQLKLKLMKVLVDIRDVGSNDPEAVGLIALLGAHLADGAKMESWSGAKARLTPEGAKGLFDKLVEQGQLEMKNGKRKAAYAVQAYITSLTALASRDKEVKAQEKVLDAFLDAVVAKHREVVKSKAD